MVSARQIGLVLGPAVFAITALSAPPLGMSAAAWLVAGLVVWMAVLALNAMAGGMWFVNRGLEQPEATGGLLAVLRRLMDPA